MEVKRGTCLSKSLDNKVKNNSNFKDRLKD